MTYQEMLMIVPMGIAKKVARLIPKVITVVVVYIYFVL